MNKVKQIRDALELNNAKFAEKLDVPYMTVVNWVNNGTEPKDDYKKIFAKKIDKFNIAYFYDDNAPMFIEKTKLPSMVGEGTKSSYGSSKPYSVPVYGRVAAGVSIALWDNAETTIEITHDVLKKLKKDIYGFLVTGDSMLPRFRKDDILITKKLDLANDEHPKDRDFIVTVFKYENETSNANIKLFNWRNKDKKEFILSSLNTYERSAPHIDTMKNVRHMFRVHLVLSEINYHEKT